MKNIQVTDEMHKALMGLSKEINNQNHRHTAMPYFFQIQTDEEVAAYPGCGEEIWVGGDSQKLRDDDEIKEYIRDYDKDVDINDIDLEEWLLDNDFRKVQITTEKKYENAFFTAKACKLHIEQNNYHYNKPVD